MLNVAEIIGNLGQLPEVRTFANGDRYAKLTVASNEKFMDSQNQEREETEWHTVIVRKKKTVAYIEQFVKRGHRVFVRGKIHYRKYKADDGSDRWFTEIVVAGADHKLIHMSPKDLAEAAEAAA